MTAAVFSGPSFGESGRYFFGIAKMMQMSLIRLLRLSIWRPIGFRAVYRLSASWKQEDMGPIHLQTIPQQADVQRESAEGRHHDPGPRSTSQSSPSLYYRRLYSQHPDSGALLFYSKKNCRVQSISAKGIFNRSDHRRSIRRDFGGILGQNQTTAQGYGKAGK